jgi:hypothetical protein
LPLCASWHHRVEYFVDLPYLSAGSGRKFFFGAFTIVSCVDLVVGRDVGCGKKWIISRQVASFMSRLVGLINSNKARLAFWPSLYRE